MKKVLWILMVFVVSCSGSSSPGEYIEPADEDNGVFEVECDKHEDCYPEHTFCVKGLCTGEPQPEFLPAGEDASNGVNEDANENGAPVEPQGSPWGRVNYNKDASATEDTAVENDAEGPANEEPPEEVLVCLEDADCDDGDANTWDYCIGFACLNVVGVSNEPECVASDEVCDGLDNDCDGVADNGVLNACGGCGDVPVEICDNVDNDCDGETDEGVLNACGKCGPVPYEYCNGLDDDCDGEVDEVCACFANAEQKCTTTDFVYYEIGECKYGTQKCVSGNWGACVGAVGPIAETCDGLDNDCDGAIDNGVLKPDGSCAECLSNSDCPSGGSCNCTESGNVLCTGTTGKCLFGECQTGEVETKCQFGCANSECVQCLSDADCLDSSNYYCLNENHVETISKPKCVAGKCKEEVIVTECEFGCDNSVCNTECNIDADCDDGSPCTKDECQNGSCWNSDNKCVSYGGEVGIMLTCEEDADCQGSPFGDYCYGPDGPYGFKHCFPCVNASNEQIPCKDPAQVCFWHGFYFESSDESITTYKCKDVVCKSDSDCDDGNPCTQDDCLTVECSHVAPTNCKLCESDADCEAKVVCDDNYGGVSVFPGKCLPYGFCKWNSYITKTESSQYGCSAPIQCNEVEDCPGGSCVNWYCYYENGQYPECIKDEHCGVGQFCNNKHECDWKGDLQCAFQCPAEMKYAVVWFGANQTANIECGTGVFKVAPETLCLWGQANPTFKYNLWDGQNWWSWGDKAVLTCNDETFKVTPDPNLGNAGVQIVSFTDLTCSF